MSGSFETLTFEFGDEASPQQLRDLVRLAIADLSEEEEAKVHADEALSERWPAALDALERAALDLVGLNDDCVQEIRVQGRRADVDLVLREEAPSVAVQEPFVAALEQVARELGGEDPRLLAQRREAERRAGALAEVEDASFEELLAQLEGLEAQLRPLEKVFLGDFRLRVQAQGATEGQRARAAEIIVRRK